MTGAITGEDRGVAIARSCTMEANGTWQEWLVVAGYLSFALFILWRVIVSSTPKE